MPKPQTLHPETTGEGDTEKSKYTLPTPPPENPPVRTLTTTLKPLTLTPAS
jgi:hypothetical protein